MFSIANRQLHLRILFVKNYMVAGVLYWSFVIKYQAENTPNPFRGKNLRNFPRSGKGIVSQDILIRFCYNKLRASSKYNLEQRQV
jgi:hypothetical protein